MRRLLIAVLGMALALPIAASAQTGTATNSPEPFKVRKLADVKTLAPIPRPRQIMMTAVNFYSHIAENAAPAHPAVSAPVSTGS